MVESDRYIDNISLWQVMNTVYTFKMFWIRNLKWFDYQVDKYAVNQYWGMGRPDYTKIKVQPCFETQANGLVCFQKYGSVFLQ